MVASLAHHNMQVLLHGGISVTLARVERIRKLSLGRCVRKEDERVLRSSLERGKGVRDGLPAQ